MVQEMRYDDSGEMAAVIKHKVEDGKLVVDMRHTVQSRVSNQKKNLTRF